MTVLVLGTGGLVGGRVAEQLQAEGVPVRAGSRTGAPPFDWHRPETWEPLLAGVRRLFLVSPEGVAVDPAFLTAAASCGVERVVLLSDRNAEVMRVQRLLDAEDLVRASGLAWTLLRPDWFDQDFSESFFRPGVLEGLITVPVGSAGQGFVDAADIAAVAVRALVDDGHDGRSYDLTGPAAVTFDEAVAAIGEACGRVVRFEGDPEAYRRGREALAVPAATIEREIGDFAALAAQVDCVPSPAVEQVTGRPATSFATFARAAAAAGAWS